MRRRGENKLEDILVLEVRCKNIRTFVHSYIDFAHDKGPGANERAV
jgi:hypothetical protein